MDIFFQRRFWIAALPAIVMVGQALGVPLTEDALTTVGDKVLAAAQGVLALWSLFAPKAPKP